jgi:hypothetical protein
VKTIQPLITIRHGLLAGLVGGLAEMGWVTLYARATGGNIAMLARGITTAAGMSAVFPAYSEAMGVTVHMVLASVLGVVLAFAWRASVANRRGSRSPYPFMLAALTVIWAINFLVVLPLVSRGFVHLVPFTVSLTSKLLFGLASAEVFRRQNCAAKATCEVSDKVYISERT